MAKKVTYYFDNESLAYRKIKPKFSKKLGRVLVFVLAAMLSGFLCFVILLNTSLLDTPKDRLLQRELDQMRWQYGLVHQQLDQMSRVLQAIEERDNAIYRAYFNQRALPLDTIPQAKAVPPAWNHAQPDALIRFSQQQCQVLAQRLAQQSVALDEIVTLAQKKDQLLAAIPAIQPVRNENLRQMASGFGYRTDPFTKVTKMHEGMDFTARTGTPVFATGNGVVVRADNKVSGYGQHIVIRHGFGYETLYGHLSAYHCRPGQRVKRGQLIGRVGSTGRSEAPHLHYEVRKDGRVVNPINYYYANISAAEYAVISHQANQQNQSLD